MKKAVVFLSAVFGMTNIYAMWGHGNSLPQNTLQEAIDFHLSREKVKKGTEKGTELETLKTVLQLYEEKSKAPDTKEYAVDCMWYLGDECIGCAYYYGKEAVEYLKLGADFYEKALPVAAGSGRFLDKIKESAARCYEMLGDVYAQGQKSLGELYYKPLCVDEPDLQKAEQFYRRACELDPKKSLEGLWEKGQAPKETPYFKKGDNVDEEEKH